jgi:hypothetical protein
MNHSGTPQKLSQKLKKRPRSHPITHHFHMCSGKKGFSKPHVQLHLTHAQPKRDAPYLLTARSLRGRYCRLVLKKKTLERSGLTGWEACADAPRVPMNAPDITSAMNSRRFIR